MLDSNRDNKYNLLPRCIKKQALTVKHNVIHKHLFQDHRNSD